ncbi:biotin/lipoyl-binding protein, partial [Acinetobacter venetianus]|uniref:biotin/lipoyl-binding protein n=1 Tax=Acinetobacter venetianus TaxID=52133 RepID=UPI0012DA0463
MASQTPQKTKKKVWFILAIIIVLLIIGVVIWQIKADKNTAETKDKKDSNLSPKAALTVTVIQPEVQNWKQTFTANGNIAAWQEVVISSELSGQRLTKVNVNVGDKVRRGQVLAEINSDTIQADLA